MHGKKAQAGIPMHYLIILIVSVMAVGVVIYAAVKAETTRKLSELPGFEEKIVDETVELPDVCPVKVGIIQKQREIYDAWWELNKGEIDYAFVRTPSDIVQTGFHYIVTDVFLYENKLYLDTESEDIEIGVLEERAGKQQLVFYCDWESRVKGEATFSTSLNELGNSFFISRFVQNGQMALCRENRTYDIFECAGGDKLKTDFLASMISNPLVALQKSGVNYVTCSTPHARIRGKFYLINREYLTAPDNKGIGNRHNVKSGLDLEFVWDECKNKSFVISYSSFIVSAYSYSSSDLTNAVVQTQIFTKDDFQGDSQKAQSEIISKILKIGGNSYIKEASPETEAMTAFYINRILNATNLTDFADKITRFTSYYCGVSRSETKLKEYGWSDFWQGTFSNQRCEQQDEEEIKKTFWRENADYTCCNYQCNVNGELQECKQANEKFCFASDTKKCVKYASGDKFAFYDSVSSGIYVKTLTETGML